MSILTANLKFFYQRPLLVGLFLIPGCISAFILPLLFMEGPKQGIFNCVIWELGISVFFGVLFASVWKETLGKPLSYCLPGGHEVPRKVLLTAGAGINIVLAIFILFLHAFSGSRSVPLHAPPRPIPHVGKQSISPASPLMPRIDAGRPKSHIRLDPTTNISLFFSAFFAGSCVYLVSVLLVFRFKRPIFIFSFIPLFYLFLVSPNTFREIENLIISHPLTLSVIGIGLGIFTWSWLGQRTLARTLCQNPSLNLMDAWNQEKMKKFTNMALARKSRPQDERQREKRENFFLARMKQYGVLSVGRNLWGWLYRFLGIPGQTPGPIVLLGLLTVTLYAFWLHKPVQGVFFILPAIIAGASFPLPLKQSMLLPVGRKEQSYTVMVLVPVYTVLVMATLGVLGVFWQGLYLLIPQATVAGHTFNCNPFEWTYFYSLLVFLPIFFTLRRFFSGSAMLPSMVLAMIGMPAGFFLCPWLAARGIVTILVLTGISWALCLLAYRDYFRRANLVGPGRG